MKNPNDAHSDALPANADALAVANALTTDAPAMTNTNASANTNASPTATTREDFLKGEDAASTRASAQRERIADVSASQENGASNVATATVSTTAVTAADVAVADVAVADVAVAPREQNGAASTRASAEREAALREAPMMIQITGVTKSYRELTAVKNLNLTIRKGDVFGFIGPNGAGKTTTIKILATLLEPTTGQALVDGVDVVRNPLEVRRLIGYMPDFFGVYDDVKVWEYLDFFAAAYKIPVNKRKSIIDDVLELTDLTVKREAYVESLSRGMKQRLCLAKTLVHDPKVLLLDEPASGLDPRARIEFRALLKELQAMGKTIFVSSHILPELADFCNVVGIMEKGNLIVAGRVDEIVRKLEGALVLDVRLTGETTNGARALQLLQGYPEVREARAEGNHLEIEFTGMHDELPQLLSHLVGNGIPVANFAQRAADLEDVFMKVTAGAVQ